MKGKYTKFQNLSLEEKKEVLKWRNYPEIRKYLFNKDEIPLEDHLKFIESLKKRDDKIYIKVSDIGIVNFEIKEYIEIGLHKNPEKKGVGKKLLDFALNYAFNELKTKKVFLEVFEENKKAINLYKNFGFREIEKKENLIKMELCYENWKNRHREKSFYNS